MFWMVKTINIFNGEEPIASVIQTLLLQRSQ